MTADAPFDRDGHVSVRVVLKANGLKAEGSTDLTSAQAQELAQSLIDEADRADSKAAARAAAKERREKWREREIAAGRMKIISLGR
jgi:hypothetical protein